MGGARALAALALVALVASAALLAGRFADPAPAVGLPRDGDVVRYFLDDVRGARDRVITLQWSGTGLREDAAGRARDAWLLLELDEIEGRDERYEREHAFDPAEAAPIAVAERMRDARASAELPFPREGAWDVRTVSFVPGRVSVEHCAARAGWQGLAFDAIAGASLHALCPHAPREGVLDEERALVDVGERVVGGVAGRAFESRVGKGTYVTRWTFAPGFAYPLEIWSHGPGATVLTTLVGFEPGRGEALPRAGARATLDPAAGLSLAEIGAWGAVDASDGETAPIPFRAADAIAAIEGAPGLGDLAAYRARNPDARVVAFEYFENRTSSPGLSGARPTWRFYFADSAGESRAVEAAAAPRALSPAGAADAGGVAAVPRDLGRVDLPPLDAASIPARGASLASAASAWRSFDPDAASSLAPNRVVGVLQPDARAFTGVPPLPPGRTLFVGHVGYEAEPDVPRALYVATFPRAGLAVDPATGARQVGTAQDREDRHDVPLATAAIAPPAIAVPAPPRTAVSWPAAGAAGSLALALAALAWQLGLLARVAAGAAWPLYSRITGAHALDNPARALLLDAIRRAPGIHVRSLRAQTGVRGGGASYHLAVLVREGYVVERRVGRRRCLFVAGTAPAAGDVGEDPLGVPSVARAFDAIARSPGLTQDELACVLDVDKAHVSRAVRRLEAAGLVRRERDGRAMRLRALRARPQHADEGAASS